MEGLWCHLKESLIAFITLVIVYVIAINLVPISPQDRYVVYLVALVIFLVGRWMFAKGNEKNEKEL
ncbi:hypothetical protein DS745_12120 [Anaerobacillus alkaliphilus]|uniref:Uncharacterized protein n=1 Tax=Anaerobacillus alkaliphilus TaxID=1548597 RepID=A0A4Q0VTB7_9BACI|nr:hypothetical protein [Anaerobacillus alkaliphilus]RXJ00273.1 hypothetical protein DS745_12120 [Anaerobacillus alkaliphilus]